MAPLLEVVQAHLSTRVALGVAVAVLVATPVRLRYSALLTRDGLDLAGLALYQRSGYWLAGLTGFTATFLPSLLVPVACVTIVLATLSTLLVGGLRNRSTP